MTDYATVLYNPIDARITLLFPVAAWQGITVGIYGLSAYAGDTELLENKNNVLCASTITPRYPGLPQVSDRICRDNLSMLHIRQKCLVHTSYAQGLCTT